MIQSEVEDRFSEALLDGIVREGDLAYVDLDEDLDHLVVSKKISDTTPEAMAEVVESATDAGADADEGGATENSGAAETDEAGDTEE